jgi:hypothetical protein
MTPYRYPAKRHRRRHGPEGYENLQSFRPWLRDEFQFTCVYCLQREQWTNVVGAFHIEHFQPVAIAPSSTLIYDNLLYACTACNALKGDQQVPDPLTVLLSDTVVVRPDGRIEGLTKPAGRLIELMGLDDPAYRERRRLILRIVVLAEQHDPVLYRMLLRFPSDLPNLARLRPPRNKRPDGIRRSHFALRQRGALPETY